MENSTQVVSRSWGHASGMAGPKKAQYLPWAQPNPAGRPVCPAPTSLQTLEMEIWAGKQQTRSCLGLDLPTGLQCHLSLFKQLREARGRKAM